MIPVSEHILFCQKKSGVGFRRSIPDWPYQSALERHGVSAIILSRRSQFAICDGITRTRDFRIQQCFQVSPHFLSRV